MLKTGSTLVLVGIATTLLMLVVIRMVDKGPKIDYDSIDENGKSAIGVITHIETQYNIAINNQHPSIIHYRYQHDGTIVAAEYRTLSPDEVNRLAAGDSIFVKHFRGESIITTLPPFKFPTLLFLAVPGFFIIIGLPFLLILICRVRRTVQLMKFGIVTEAEVIAMIYKPGLPVTKIGQGLRIHYQYQVHRRQTHLAEAFSADLLLNNSLKQGDTIKIFVSPKDNAKSMLIPQLEALRNGWEL